VRNLEHEPPIGARAQEVAEPAKGNRLHVV